MKYIIKLSSNHNDTLNSLYKLMEELNTYLSKLKAREHIYTVDIDTFLS